MESLNYTVCHLLGLNLTCQKVERRLDFRFSDTALQSPENISCYLCMLVRSVVPSALSALYCPTIDPLHKATVQQLREM